MLNLTPLQEKSLLQAVKGKKSITAKEYRDSMRCKATKKKSLQMSSKEFNKARLKKTPKEKRSFTFTATIEQLEKNKKYLFTIRGIHLSTNSVNSLSFGDKLRYKTAVKKGMENAALIYRSLIPKIPFSKVVLIPTSFQTRSRDDDNLYATTKIIRDSIVSIGFVEDDKRENLRQERTEEVISKEWKIEVEMNVTAL